MTHLRKMMLEELERRNYAQTTIDCYIQTVEDFARYFRRPPDQLTPDHIRKYQAYLFRERKLAASTVTQRLAALRFFALLVPKQGSLPPISTQSLAPTTRKLQQTNPACPFVRSTSSTRRLSHHADTIEFA
jgi:site-specific recombinase XerD